MCSSSMKGMTGVTRPYKKISVNMPKPTVMRMKAVLDRHWSPIGAELRTLLSDMFGDGPVGVWRGMDKRRRRLGTKKNLDFRGQELERRG